MAKTKKQLGGKHMFRTTKYGFEELLGMKTKVSTVKGTTGGRVQTVEALGIADFIGPVQKAEYGGF